MSGKDYLAQLTLNIAGLRLLIHCDEPVLRCPHAGVFTNSICGKHRPDIIFHIHFGRLPIHGYEKKIVLHKSSEAPWCLYHIKNNRLCLRWRVPMHPFSYSVIIDDEKGLCDFYFEQREAILKDGLDISTFNFEYPLILYMQPQFEGILLHACAVDYGGKTLIFSGTSGKGKSTLTELWQSRRAVRVLGDERVIIRKKRDPFLVYSVPWKKQLVEPALEPAKLCKIFFLRHDSKNIATRKTRADACALILDQSFHTFWDKTIMEQTLKFIDEMTREISCFDLGFVPNATVLDYLDYLQGVQI